MAGLKKTRIKEKKERKQDVYKRQTLPFPLGFYVSHDNRSAFFIYRGLLEQFKMKVKGIFYFVIADFFLYYCSTAVFYLYSYCISRRCQRSPRVASAAPIISQYDLLLITCLLYTSRCV